MIDTHPLAPAGAWFTNIKINPRLAYLEIQNGVYGKTPPTYLGAPSNPTLYWWLEVQNICIRKLYHRQAGSQ